MRKAVIFVSAIALLILVSVSPVLAIGPFKGAEKSENDNFEVLWGGLLNNKGEARGYLSWAWIPNDEYWVKWNWQDASPEKGLVNNALVVSPPMPGGTKEADTAFMDYLLEVAGEANDNKWIFLSGDSGPYTYEFRLLSIFHQYGNRGMLFWMVYFTFLAVTQSMTKAFDVADPIADNHLYGQLWLHNRLNGNTPKP